MTTENKKVTQQDVDNLEKELSTKEAKLDFKLTLKELDFIRQSLQRMAEFQKEEAIKLNNRAYYNASEKAERIAKRSQAMMTAEILADNLWEKTNLYKDYICPIRDMEWEMESK
jgi:hypothetical protein